MLPAIQQEEVDFMVKAVMDIQEVRWEEQPLLVLQVLLEGVREQEQVRYSVQVQPLESIQLQ
jgi:hypothetical protein